MGDTCLLALQQLATQRKGMVDPQQLEATRVRAFAVVHKIFLIHLPLLRTVDDFEDLWGNMLDVNERFLSLPGAELQEAVPESLKNVLLVLIDDGLLVENNALWALTFGKVDTFSPQMRAELANIIRGGGQAEAIAAPVSPVVDPSIRKV